ncbi:MAG: zf-HC2 domain-containing protein [Elusimicrobia bacterium]|nr:zf-HC2 domain-containing protein [Elusimicrobiota bacterium]
MTHEKIRESLSEWLDGELDPAASAAVAAHLDACSACRTEAGRLRRLGAALFEAPVPADPRANEAFVARVMARVEADSVPVWERFAARVLAPALGLALAGLVFAIAMPDPDEDAPLGVAAASADAGSAFEAAP